MNKNELIKNMSQAYLLLSEKRKEEFSRILNRLLAVNFICGGRKRDREDYYFISENEQLFKVFLMMLDYDFHLYKADRVIYIHNLNNKYYSLRSKRKSNIKKCAAFTQAKMYICI